MNDSVPPPPPPFPPLSPPPPPEAESGAKAEPESRATGGGWFDSLVKKASELTVEGVAETVKKQLTKEVKELKQAGQTLASAMSDLGEVASGDKDMTQFFATYRPKLQGWLRRDLGPRWCRLIYDDNAVVPAITTYYDFLPPPLPWFVKKESFLDFCMKHRDTLLGARKLRTGELREGIETLCEIEAEEQALRARVAGAHGVEVADERVAAEAKLAVRYVKSVPDLLQSTADAAAASERYDSVFPVLSELEFHFLEGDEEPPATLLALLETSYLALSLIQTLSDQSIEREFPPLIDVDLRPANARMRKLLGDSTRDLDTKVASIVKDSEFMERAGKVAGKAVPVIAVAAQIAAVTSALAGGGGGGDVDVDLGGGASSSCASGTPGGPTAYDHALSNAYTGALFGSECVARF